MMMLFPAATPLDSVGLVIDVPAVLLCGATTFLTNEIAARADAGCPTTGSVERLPIASSIASPRLVTIGRMATHYRPVDLWPAR
jgi:hypothetical protein